MMNYFLTGALRSAVMAMLSLPFLSMSDAGARPASSPDFRNQRMIMVRTQIEARGIEDKRVLGAMMKVERHRFVPPELRGSAYEDRPLAIGRGQTISQPYIVALMTEALALDSAAKVLEVGTGSGYQAAVLAQLCDSVFTMEIDEELGGRAARLLSSLGYSRLQVRIGDGYKGWAEHAPYDGIIVTCAPTQVPQPLKDQLKEGGTMVIPVGKAGAQELMVLKKKDGALVRKNVAPVRFVPMVDSAGVEY